MMSYSREERTYFEAPEVIGRERERRLIRAAVRAGRDILLEGPPGTSKSTLLRSVSQSWGVGFQLVEGNAELTPARLVGYHDPARVLAEGYSAETFVAGPLVEAMRAGSFLYIEELNRAPEDSLNMLLAAMADRAVVVPRYGVVEGRSTFRLLASMNPFDNIGTARISDSVYDRWCRLVVDYQSAEEEEEIVAVRVAGVTPKVTADAVAITRATRHHAELRRGSSVRGAIDLAAIAMELGAADDAEGRVGVVLDSAMLALSARIAVDETSERTVEQVLTEIWEDHFFCVADPARRAGVS